MALSSSERNRGSAFASDTDGRLHVTNTDSSGVSDHPTAAALSDAASNPTTTTEGAALLVYDRDNATWVRASSSRVNFAAITARPLGVNLLLSDGGTNWLPHMAAGQDAMSNFASAAVGPMMFTGTTTDRQRTPNVFKTFANTAITAGTAITVWTPTSGKKFRLMGMTMSVSATTQVLVCDNTNATIVFRSPLFAAAATFTIGAGDMGNGILSGVANNVLKLDATANASVAGTVWGTEE